MNIALLGYGKMGKAIEAEALKKGHVVVVKFDTRDDWKTRKELLAKADVAIEFSMPASVVENIHRCFKAGVPVVVGTTDWDKDLKKIKQDCLDQGKSMFVASNFSVGMNLFFELNKKLAGLMNRFNQYDVKIEELHHKHKLDAPSGTAKVLADQILNEIDRKNQWVLGSPVSNDQLKVTSLREGDYPGTHTISYLSAMDEITITHTAFKRQAFASGAIMAAEWLVGKTGFFGMSDLMLEAK